MGILNYESTREEILEFIEAEHPEYVQSIFGDDYDPQSIKLRTELESCIDQLIEAEVNRKESVM